MAVLIVDNRAPAGHVPFRRLLLGLAQNSRGCAAPPEQSFPPAIRKNCGRLMEHNRQGGRIRTPTAHRRRSIIRCSIPDIAGIRDMECRLRCKAPRPMRHTRRELHPATFRLRGIQSSNCTHRTGPANGCNPPRPSRSFERNATCLPHPFRRASNLRHAVRILRGVRRESGKSLAERCLAAFRSCSSIIVHRFSSSIPAPQAGSAPHPSAGALSGTRPAGLPNCTVCERCDSRLKFAQPHFNFGGEERQTRTLTYLNGSASA